jgi:hypothetical protein
MLNTSQLADSIMAFRDRYGFTPKRVKLPEAVVRSLCAENRILIPSGHELEFLGIKIGILEPAHAA